MSRPASSARGRSSSGDFSQVGWPAPDGRVAFVSQPTAQLGGLLFLVASGCLGALALGLPALAAVVAPMGLWLLWGLMAAGQTSCQVSLVLDRDRAVEGEVVELTVVVQRARSFQRVLCSVSLPPGLTADPPPARLAMAPNRSGTASSTLSIRCGQWGIHRIDPCLVVARNAFGISQAWGRSLNSVEVNVYPAAPRLSGGVRPWATQVYVGEERARERGQGFEFADIRQYQPGDQTRRINWTVTARRSEPYVNLQHPERNVDIVLLVDAFTDLQLGSNSTLAWAGRAAAALAELHLARRDRVGLLSYGGVLRSLPPGSGTTHLYRFLDSLIETEVVSSFERPTLNRLPPRSLPPQALVIAFTPLVDPRMIKVLLELHGRGCDLAVVEIDPERFTSWGTGTGEDASRRIWRLVRSAARRDIWRSGVPLVRWDTSDPLDAALVQINQMRHGRWRVRA